MGDPRKIRAKYSRPPHPWIRSRLEKEEVIKKDYGLKTKKELWKIESKLRSFKKQAKMLAARTDQQAEKERTQLFNRLYVLGLINKDAKLDNILDLDLKDILGRRLQTFITKKGLARTISQARQMIVHEHVMVNGNKIDAPSYLVKRDEEDKISFSHDSPFLNAEHPERAVKPKVEKKVVEVRPHGRPVSRVQNRPMRVKAVPKAEEPAAVEKKEEKPVVVAA